MPAIRKVVCGDCHTLALSESGEVFTFGRNKELQLGASLGGGDPRANQWQLQRPTGLVDQCAIADIAAGSFHSVAVTLSGDVYQWGLINQEVRSPSTVDGVTHGVLTGMGWNATVNEVRDRIVQASAQQWMSAADDLKRELLDRDADEAVDGFDSGMLNVQSVRQPCAVPTLVSGLESLRIVSVAAGHAHTCCIDSAGKLWTSGLNDRGVLVEYAVPCESCCWITRKRHDRSA